jgi:ABC-type transport system involved in Fe-S cluster assembly fused permease/ATPase subunit
MEGLDRLMKGRTVIMITHRLNTIRAADTIVVLHNGVVAEQGTHDDLLAAGGIYAGLYWARPAAAAGSAVSQPIHLTEARLAWPAR